MRQKEFAQSPSHRLCFALLGVVNGLEQRFRQNTNIHAKPASNHGKQLLCACIAAAFLAVVLSTQCSSSNTMQRGCKHPTVTSWGHCCGTQGRSRVSGTVCVSYRSCCKGSDQTPADIEVQERNSRRTCVNMISSPTTNDRLDTMSSPLKTFSRISRPARPRARPPKPLMASTL